VQNAINISGEVNYTKSWVKIASGEWTRTIYLAEADFEKEFYGSSM
jgi:hypothetical protein